MGRGFGRGAFPNTSGESALKSLWDAWPRLEKYFTSKRKKLLLVDFDGTLAPIVKNPSRAVIEPRSKKALSVLSRSPFYEVIVISGRARKDLGRRLGTSHIFCIGNHGFEMSAEQGFSLPKAVKEAKRFYPLVRFLARRLKDFFLSLPGVIIENKRYGLSVHYRNLPRRFRSLFQKKLAGFRSEYRHYPVLWGRGKQLWEARLNVPWDKGKAALYLSKKFPKALPIALGDDKTDEDMFRAMKSKGITIRVGRSKRSAAEYYLRSTKDVAFFLERLCH
jgi:trehalose-phosphatase